MFDFSQVTEVKLDRGSHSSAAAGMCFMEMVAWFAGEAHSDQPECACPVLGAYGIRLNDAMPADLRDELLKPLVPMIAGTRGNLEVRRNRAEFLALWSVNKCLPIVLRARGREELAMQCEQATNIAEARVATQAAKTVSRAAAYAAYAAYAADAYAADAAAYAAYAADAYAADAAADADDAYAAARRKVYTIAVEGLRQAILIGPHEGFNAICDLQERHAALRDLVDA